MCYTNIQKLHPLSLASLLSILLPPEVFAERERERESANATTSERNKRVGLMLEIRQYCIEVATHSRLPGAAQGESTITDPWVVLHKQQLCSRRFVEYPDFQLTAVPPTQYSEVPLQSDSLDCQGPFVHRTVKTPFSLKPAVGEEN